MVKTRPLLIARLRRQARVLLQRLRRSRGVSAVEYGLMLALISVAILGSVTALGTTLFDGIYRAMLSVASV
jgi:Flp pilus assembly pilin Flp